MSGPQDALALPVDEGAAALLYNALKLKDFFPEFSAEHAQKLFPRSGLYEYPKGALVVEQGEPGHDLFVIQAGCLVVGVAKDGGTELVATLGPGDVIGEIALLMKTPRTATAVAAEASRIYRLSYQDLNYLLEHNLALAEHLRVLARQRLK